MVQSRQFNNAAPPMFTVEMGRDHAPEKVRVWARRSVNDYSQKEPLVKGALQAWARGQRANLIAFVTGYLELKRENGTIEKFENGSLDNGIQTLVCKPLVLLLEKQKEPQATLALLVESLSPFYHQALLDALLRYACAVNSWALLPDLLAAGAEANAGNGRALLNAVNKNFPRCIDAMLAGGADSARTRALLEEDNERVAFDATIDDAKKRFPDAPVPRLLPARGSAAPHLRLRSTKDAVTPGNNAP